MSRVWHYSEVIRIKVLEMIHIHTVVGFGSACYFLCAHWWTYTDAQHKKGNMHIHTNINAKFLAYEMKLEQRFSQEDFSTLIKQYFISHDILVFNISCSMLFSYHSITTWIKFSQQLITSACSPSAQFQFYDNWLLIIYFTTQWRAYSGSDSGTKDLALARGQRGLVSLLLAILSRIAHIREPNHFWPLWR